MKKLLLILIAAAGLARAEDPPHVEVSLYCFQYAPEAKTVAVRTGDASYADVTLSTANITGPVQAALTDGRVTLHRRVEGPKGEITWPVIGSAKLPDKLTRALLVLLPPASGSGETYRCALIDYTDAAFPYGSYRVANLSPFPVRGAIGKSYVELKSAAMGTIKPQGEPGEVQPSRFEFQDNNRWNLLTETRCAVRNDRRWLLCIYRDPDSGRMNLRCIPDRVPQVVATTATGAKE
ncbi:MAG: hypothetical protein QM755_02320 [Luteolibacter sp.]